MRITVFTPTFNRAYIIENLYHSLQRQKFNDFEWIVIDDGSTDNTPQLMEKLSKEKNGFPIRYIQTENGGKHRAINKGVEIASGELFFIVDSDDYLEDDALETIDLMEKSLNGVHDIKFAGICGLRGFDKSTMNGTTFKGQYLDITSLELGKYGITGDKAEVFYTRIMKEYPFPVFDGENFLTEAVVWDRIAAADYKLRYFNKIMIIGNYLSDGLSNAGEKLFIDNPKGYGLYLSQCAKFGKITGIRKWNAYLKYYYLLRDKLSIREISKNLSYNSIKFYMRVIGLKIFYKIYDR